MFEFDPNPDPLAPPPGPLPGLPPELPPEPTLDALAGVRRQTVWLLGCEIGCERCPPHAGYRDDVLGARGLKPQTWLQIRTGLRKVWTEAADGADPAALTLADYRAWQARKLDPKAGNVRGPTYSPNSLHHYDKIVWSCYRWAVAMGLVTVDPFAGKRQAKAARPVARDLPDDQVAALWALVGGLDVRMRAIIMLAASGFRVGEIAEARREGFAGGETPSLTVRRMKSLHKQRIPLDRQVAAALTALIATYDRDKGPLIESQHEPGVHVQPHWITSLVSEVMREAGARETAHGLRHTFATLLAKRGVPDGVISYLLGHRSVSSTQGYIIGAQDERARAALANAWLPGAPPGVECDGRPVGRPPGRPGPLRRAAAIQRSPTIDGRVAKPNDPRAPRSPAHPNQPVYPPIPGPSVTVPLYEMAQSLSLQADSGATESPAQAMRRARRRPRDRGLSMRRRRSSGGAQ